MRKVHKVKNIAIFNFAIFAKTFAPFAVRLI